MKSILLIEDDKSQQNILKELFQERYVVLTENSAIDGWNSICKNHPDLVILDIMLPGGMNGFDVLENIKKDAQLSAIPVLVFTNLDTEGEVSRKIGVADYFVKSNTSIQKIVEKVDALLGST